MSRNAFGAGPYRLATLSIVAMPTAIELNPNPMKPPAVIAAS